MTPFFVLFKALRQLSFNTTVFTAVLLVGLVAKAELKVLMISPEQSHIFQTGGLAHATTGLAAGLRENGIKAEILMPAYTQMESGPLVDTGIKQSVQLDWHNGQAHKTSDFSILRNTDPSNPTLFLKHNNHEGQLNYFDSRPEVNNGKKAYAPEATIGESFGAFAKASADYILSKNYDVVIINDWTTGLIALHLAEAKKMGMKVPKVVFAIHNLAYQGLFPDSLGRFLGISEAHFNIEGYEFHKKMSFLKSGLQYSDLIYTVSNQYAKEIATPRFGAGLDGLIRKKAAEGKVTGVLNGITDSEWDPSRRVTGLDFTFDAKDLSGKAKGKAALQAELGLPVNAEVPLFILTSRLAEQKGFAYLTEAIEKTVQGKAAQFAVIGDGDAAYIQQLKDLQARFPDKVRYQGFSNIMEKKLTRFGDFFVNGAWFEPSGLNQFFALKNGTVPVVSAAGGLMDSVKEGKNGFLFKIHEGANGEGYDRDTTKQSAYEALSKAVDVFQNKQQMKKLRLTAMSEDHSWGNRIRKEFRNMFDYVIKDGPNKIVQRHGPQGLIMSPTQLLDVAGLVRAPMCGAVFAF